MLPSCLSTGIALGVLICEVVWPWQEHTSYQLGPWTRAPEFAAGLPQNVRWGELKMVGIVANVTSRTLFSSE